MKSGHKVVLDDGAQEVTVTHSNGCVVTIDAAGQVVDPGQRDASTSRRRC